MLQNEEFAANDDEKTAIAIGSLLADHKGANVLVLDMRPLNFWTDFFVIATASSSTHMSGLERNIKDYLVENGREIIRVSRKIPGTEDDWRLLDPGNIAVHLMSEKARKFYELERLWSEAPVLFDSGSQT